MKDKNGGLTYMGKPESEKEDNDLNVTDVGLVLLCNWKVTDSNVEPDLAYVEDFSWTSLVCEGIFRNSILNRPRMLPSTYFQLTIHCHPTIRHKRE
jgi:hypothetical protein